MRSSKKLRDTNAIDNFYVGGLVECGPCRRRCVPPRYIAQIEEERVRSWRRRAAPLRAEGAMDPLQALGSMLMEIVFSKLVSVDLATCLAVSKSWKSCAIHDSLWKKPCERLSDGGIIPWNRYYVMYKVLVLDVNQGVNKTS